jgi:FkbM family methyltransferase
MLSSIIKKRLHQVRKALALVLHAPWRRGLIFGVGASIEHRDLISGLSIVTLVDIGANVGQFTLLVRHLHPDARIFAFEPLARPAKTFSRLFADDPKVVLHRVAIAAKEETRRMHVSRSNDSSSLLPILPIYVATFPGTEEVGRETVDTVPLDQALDPAAISAPALLKLDVQGFEFEALQGCESMLALFEHIYVEVSFIPLYEGQALAHDVVAWLAVHGFFLAGVGHISFGLGNQCVQADLLFRNACGRASSDPCATSRS